MIEFTTAEDETVLGQQGDHLYIAVQRVVRRPVSGGPEEYYGPLRTWLTTPAAQLIEREQQITRLQQMLDQALAERTEAQVQQEQLADLQHQLVEAQAAKQRAISTAEAALVERYERELTELRRRFAELETRASVPVEAQIVEEQTIVAVATEQQPAAVVERPLQPGRARCPHCQKQIWRVRLAEHIHLEHDGPAPIVIRVAQREQQAEEEPSGSEPLEISTTTDEEQAPLRLVELPEDIPGWICPRCGRDAFARAIQRDICVSCARQDGTGQARAA